MSIWTKLTGRDREAQTRETQAREAQQALEDVYAAVFECAADIQHILTQITQSRNRAPTSGTVTAWQSQALRARHGLTFAVKQIEELRKVSPP